MTVRPFFAWFDLWVGAYWDRRAKRLYVLPLPCLGIVVEFGGRTSSFPRRSVTSTGVITPPAFPLVFATREIAQACIDRMLPGDPPCRVEENTPGVTCAPSSPT